MRTLSLIPLLCTAALFAQEPTLSVEEAVTSALAFQPRLQAAKHQQQAVEAREQQAAWNRAGTLDTSLTYFPRQKSQLVELPSFGPGIPAQSFEMTQARKYDLTASINQPLWAWGALSRQHASARKESEAGRMNVDRAHQQVVFDATRAFCQASLAIDGVSVARQNLEQQQEFLRVAAQRVKAGSSARVDELKAELAVAQAESSLSEALNRERLAREVLASQTQDSRFRSAGLKALKEDGTDLPDEEEAVARALSLRCDLKALQGQAQALELSAQAAKASRLPVLSFRATVTQQNDVSSLVFRKDSQSYSAGLALTWEGVSPFRARARVAELDAMARSAAQYHRSGEFSVALEVRTALLSVREARERVSVQQRAAVVAQEQARIARLAYREGTLSAVETQDAELSLTAARYALLRAGVDASLARSSLRLALGE